MSGVDAERNVFVLWPKAAKKKPMTAREAGRRGGRTTAARHGHAFYATIGRKGGAVVSRDREFMARIGAKGGHNAAAKRLKEQLRKVAVRSVPATDVCECRHVLDEHVAAGRCTIEDCRCVAYDRTGAVGP